ncbi:SIS domain-containing protein [Candidatus Fermentibacteria bacterium]|nr:SIS domain-containing protein [Candidatus Fermentibacteria bacterium]
MAKSALGAMDAEGIRPALDLCAGCLRNGGKLIFCGNGGSAADAQHLAAELTCRFRKDREPLAGVALTGNIASITAIANDYDFGEVFSRQVEALGRPGDVLVAISTSGSSENVLKAARTASRLDMGVLGMTGGSGGELAELCDVVIRASSDTTSHVQECLLVAGHALCYALETQLTRSRTSKERHEQG